MELANNHPLNTALVMLTTAFSDDVFLIRLPNVVAGVLYLVTAALVASKTTKPLLSLAVLALNPYLLEFFSLARGYGLAAALVMVALGRYFFGRVRTVRSANL